MVTNDPAPRSRLQPRGTHRRLRNSGTYLGVDVMEPKLYWWIPWTSDCFDVDRRKKARQEAIDAATAKLLEAAQAIADYHDSGCSIIGVPGDSIRISALKAALTELKEASK